MNLRRLLRPARSRLLFLIPVVPAILVACNEGDSQSTFGTSGPIADTQADLFIFIFWIAVVVFVLVEGALVYSIIKFRRRDSDDSLPTQTHGNTKLEIIWTIVPAIILVAIAIPTIKVIYDQAEVPTNQGPVLEIKVRAHQWWWEVEYPGEDVVTANEIRIPVGQWVNFTLNSDDVIHSFWVPKLAGKVDIIPGDVRELAMRADEPGFYFGQCAEFCGEAHAKMRFRVKAEAPEDFQAWLDSMRRPPVVLESADAIAGQAVFAQNCSSCHATNTWQGIAARNERTRLAGLRAAFLDNTEDSVVIAAPNLTHFATRETLGAGLIELNETNLTKWITDPDDVKEGNRMKDLALPYRNDSLSTEDVRQLVAYLLELEPVAADAVIEPAVDAPSGGTAIERGEAVFTNNGCSGCHSTGEIQILGPGLAGISSRGDDAYIRESILDPGAKFAEGFDSSVMPANFGSTLSTDEIDDLIAYLKTL